MEIGPFVFSRPPVIYFGANSAARLGSIVSGFGTSVLWVHGSSGLSRQAVRDSVASCLEKSRLSVFELEIASEPTPADVDKAVAQFGREKIDAVLSVGGGSVIDAGKAISAMLTLDKPVLDYCEVVGTRKHPGTKLPFIAAPTTAGTGAEATCNAVLSDVGPNGFKASLRHANLVPDVAVVDPSLSLSCPAGIASACGMDALTQLLESFVSTKAGALTDALAASGLERLKDNLVPSCMARPDDIEIRTNVSYAALLSGITLANAGLGVVHGFASAIGGMFRIPHGVVCGTLLVPCVKRTIEKLVADGGPVHHIVKFAQAGEILCGRRGDTAEETCEMLTEKLSEYARKLAIPSFSSFGITASSIAAIIEKTDNRNNPVVLTQSDLRSVLTEVNPPGAS